MVAPYCSPEDDCPGTGFGVTDTNGGIQILGAASVSFDSDLHEGFHFDCARQAGAGQYFQNRSYRKVYTAAERAALAGADVYDGLEVYESDTDITYVRSSGAWLHRWTPTTAFTAVLRQNAATVASTQRNASYVVRDGWCKFMLQLDATAAAVAGVTAMGVRPTGLPAPLAPGGYSMGNNCGQWHFVDIAPGQNYGGWCDWDGTDLLLMSDANNNFFGITPDIDIAIGDSMRVSGEFRVS